MYESGYENVDVYSLSPEQFAEVGRVWREGLEEAYSNPRNQRYRRSISFKKVAEEGRAVLKIEDGLLAAT
ncbi:MAG: hypothetical protein ACRDSJ_11435 [Rubrobacteraceae bacterium]